MHAIALPPRSKDPAQDQSPTPMLVHTHPPPHPCLPETHLLLLSASPYQVRRPLWPQAPFLFSWAKHPHRLRGCPQLPAPESPMGSNMSSWLFP